jgi:hypothetical protein
MSYVQWQNSFVYCSLRYHRDAYVSFTAYPDPHSATGCLLQYSNLSGRIRTGISFQPMMQ